MRTPLPSRRSPKLPQGRFRLILRTGGLLLLLCTPGVGDETHGSRARANVTARHPAPPRWDWMMNGARWDARHRRASDSIVQAVDRLDRLFGDESMNEENRRTRMTLSLGLEHTDRDGLSLTSDLRLRVSLPRLEERLQLILDDAFEVDQPEDRHAIADAVRDRKPDAGLRYFLSRKENFRISTDMGVRLKDPVQWFARTRWSLRMVLDSWDVRLTETLLWFTNDGWRGISDVNFNRPLSSCWQFRSSSRLTLEEIRDGFTPAQNISFSWQPGERHAWRFYLSGVWPEAPHTREANYSAGIVFRRRIHRNWLYMEVSPSIEFPQADQYAVNTVAGLKFEVIFGSE